MILLATAPEDPTESQPETSPYWDSGSQGSDSEPGLDIPAPRETETVQLYHIPPRIAQKPVYWWRYADHSEARRLNPQMSTEEYIEGLPIDQAAKANLSRFFEQVEPPTEKARAYERMQERRQQEPHPSTESTNE